MENINNSPTKVSVKRSMPLMAILCLVIIALIVGLYFYGHRPASKANDVITGPYKFNYSKLDSYTLLGKDPGDGITFKKPVEITGPDGQSHFNIRLSQNMFFQFINKTNQKVSTQAGVILVASEPIAQPLTADNLKAINTEVQKPSSPTSKNYKSTLLSFISSRESSYSINVGNLEPLASKSLPNNAWVATYAAAPKNNVSATTYPSSKGEVVVAIGQHAFYYFAIQTIDYNWQLNSSVWPQVLNSIKIDQ